MLRAILLAITSVCFFPAQAQSTGNTPTYGTIPAVLSSGTVSITLIGANLPRNPVVLLEGKPLKLTASADWYLIATGYLPLWKSGTATLTVASSATTPVVGHIAIPIAQTGATFDTAARFSTQAAFGPRPDVVRGIQQLGLSDWVRNQFSLPAVVYDPNQPTRPQFLRAATTGNSLLRLRVAYALQTFLVSQCIFIDSSCLPYEQTLERDSSGFFRDLLNDLASDASMGQFLNLAGNAAPRDPTQHPNQNFARELMQLFTLGPDLLNDDGTLQHDASGNPIPTYTQNQVADLSRVFTGWNLGSVVNPAYTGLGVDYSQPLQSVEGQHDQGPKTIVGNLYIPSNQGIRQDRKYALDAIFNHPNLPPRIARLLIQHLVKSNPTPAYVQRISRVFQHDGSGFRGNLSAVVTAILLDPEARAGDTASSSDDGFLQDPLLFQTFATSINELPVWDNNASFMGPQLGQNWWYAPSVFGFYRPDYLIPGTAINSPEFQIFNNISAINRSVYLWNLLSGTTPGYGLNQGSWLLSTFKTVPDLVEALNHLAFHGQMSAAQQSAIIAYCATLPSTDPTTQLRSAIFLALNSDNYVVSH